MTSLLVLYVHGVFILAFLIAGIAKPPEKIKPLRKCTNVLRHMEPFQRKQSFSGLHRPSADREDSLLPPSLSVSEAEQGEKAKFYGKYSK